MIRAVPDKPIRLSGNATPSSTAADAAAAIAGPALRAVLHGQVDVASGLIAEYDDETLAALGAAADHLASLCRARMRFRS